MKAMIYTEYGSADVLQYKELEKPVPADHQVLVKVHAAAINAADTYLLRGNPFMVRFDTGLQRPKNIILGADVAGRVEAVGKNVQHFRIGDEVFGDLSGCGLGGFAEYVAVPEDMLALKPASLTFEQAAAVPMAAVTALQGLRLGQIQSGQKVLIYGASGGVGTFAVQIAKALGAEVTGVCSTAKMELVRSLGADHVMDYTKENFTRSGQRYDLIIAANGYLPLLEYRRALTPKGRHVVTGGALRQIFQAMLLGSLVTIGSKQKMSSLMAKPNRDDLAFVGNLMEAGKVTPVIDRQFPLAELAAAMRYMEQKHARGKVIITIAQSA